jgi:hypothetical protein
VFLVPFFFLFQSSRFSATPTFLSLAAHISVTRRTHSRHSPPTFLPLAAHIPATCCPHSCHLLPTFLSLAAHILSPNHTAPRLSVHIVTIYIQFPPSFTSPHLSVSQHEIDHLLPLISHILYH